MLEKKKNSVTGLNITLLRYVQILFWIDIKTRLGLKVYSFIALYPIINYALVNIFDQV